MYFPRYISLGYVCLLFSLLDRLVFYLLFTLGLKKTGISAQDRQKLSIENVKSIFYFFVLLAIQQIGLGMVCSGLRS
ncbi:MAG: hypothetical protein JWN60_463 [Acidobacteria bacterium]|nr:hypothetical protein [Acidobacteriota bacterium]